MKNPGRVLTVIGILSVGLAGGWGVGGIRHTRLVRSSQSTPPPPEPPPLPKLVSSGTTASLTDQTRQDWLADLSTPEDCQRLIQSLTTTSRRENPLFTEALRDYALRRWLELDPENALTFVEKSEGDPALAGHLFRVWVGLDPDSALAAYAQASPATVTAARRDLFAKLAETDPQRAVEELEGPRWKLVDRDYEYEHEQTTRLVYSLWAEIDPEAAARRAIDGRNGLNSMVAAVAGVWAQHDPEAAWRFFQPSLFEETNAGHPLPAGLATAILPHLLKIDGSALDHLPGDSERLRIELARRWSDQNPVEAITFAQGRPADDPLRRELLAHAARNLATADPERALQLYQDSAGGSANGLEDSNLLRESFASLAATDRDAAATRLKDFSGEDRTAAISGILTHAFADDITAGTKLCREWLADPAMKDSVVPALNVALSWGHGSGNHDLGPILQQLPEFAAHVDGYPLQGWTRTDPEAAAAFMKSRAAVDPNIEFDAKAVDEICFSRPEFTAQWLMQLPAGQFQESTAKALAKTWARFDPDAAHAWARSLPEGTLQDDALGKLGIGPFEEDLGSVGE